jgi:alpha-L-rhamnosidase
VLTHGETTDVAGDVTLENVAVPRAGLGPVEGLWDLRNLELPFQTDELTSDGVNGFEPRHTTHGFRYVRVEGVDELASDDVAAVVVHTDMRRTGWFECSDERVNRLHEAAVWSFRGNACDIPTDCPTRERQGWTGDWQLFAPVAAFLYDVAGFSTKWLRDLAAEQEPDGVVQNCAPDPQRIPGGSADNPFPPGSAGWGDAAVIVPWEMYRAYGDLRLLEDQWASMTAWVDYAATRAREGRHPDRVAARPEPAAHERFLWDTGAHWGEWLEPGEPVGDDIDEFLATHRPLDQGDVATAYLHHSAQIVGQVARVLGRTEDASRYDELAAHTLGAWRAEFIRDNRLVRDTQASYVRALAFGLAPEELRPAIRARLAELIRQAGTHLNTGFLATPYLLPVLADGGRADLAYELLLQDTEPSWLAMIDKGATTIWELWDAVGDDGVPTGSLNHYSKGAVISFLHRYVGGIRLGDEPAYRRFRVEPLPGGGITWARATHDAPYGRIEVAWRLEDGGFGLELTVPPGTVADVLLPDGRSFEAPPGRSAWERGGHAAVDVQ